MFIVPLAYDYATFHDPGDRLRRTRARTSGSRVRRAPAGATRG